MQGQADNPHNFMTSFGVLIVSFLFALIPYLSTVVMYGTFNSEKWHAMDASLVIMTAVVLSIFGALFYLTREYEIDVEGVLINYIDINELVGKKYLDYFLAHYGHVASTASFCAAIVYVAKWLLPELGISVTALFMSVTVCLVFLMYGLVFAKVVWGARHRRWPAFVMLFPMVFLDIILITMAIKGASSLYIS